MTFVAPVMRLLIEKVLVSTRKGIGKAIKKLPGAQSRSIEEADRLRCLSEIDEGGSSMLSDSVVVMHNFDPAAHGAVVRVPSTPEAQGAVQVRVKHSFPESNFQCPRRRTHQGTTNAMLAVGFQCLSRLLAPPAPGYYQCLI